ncbi:polysaccharide deacetylase family protein [Salinispora cortesiana]|uniref:polysaccharide deacetylase family protein n=1 Tax=Salinispora cortesiana TaxID=1305843 RepID=UPI00046F4A58|nr:polysaccharide deacetylase family protein [Salinispora cortesiana]
MSGLRQLTPATRFLAIAAVVVIALLGSAFAIGRGIAPTGAPVTGSATTPNPTDQPAASETPSPDDPATAAGRDGGTAANPESTAVDESSPAAPEPTPSSDYYDEGALRTTGTSTVTLTFDDGPDPQYTPQILSSLREYGVTATFCVTGQNASAYPELVQAIVADGHTLCNHTWDHDIALGSRSPDEIRADLTRTSNAIHAAVPDAPITYYRQPGGAWTYSVVSAAQELGLTPLHWTIDPRDWESPGVDPITATVLGGVQPGSIVLLHDAGGPRQDTVDALNQILPELTARFPVAALPPNVT